MTTPNLLSLLRLASAPVFLVLFIGTAEGGFLSWCLSPWQGLLACLVVAVLSEASDILDGIFARRWHQVSDFGKLLDPYADSVFRLSCYFAFASHAHGRWIPLWMAMVLLYRDLLVTVIRNFALERRQIIGARASGKIKAIAQGAVVITVLVIALTRGEEWVSYPPPAKGRVATGVAHSLMWIVTLVTAWSAWDYFWANRRLFTRATHPQEGGEADPPA